MASEVERVALTFEGVSFAQCIPAKNPVTGQHAELEIQFTDTSLSDPAPLRDYLIAQLPTHMVPRRIRIASAQIGHRFKRV